MVTSPATLRTSPTWFPRICLRCEQPLGGEVFNVGTGRRISLRDLVDAINSCLGTRIDPEFGPPRAGDVRHSHASLAKIAAALDYQPIVDFEDGLRRTLAADGGIPE
jgi:UDP-glucose 4-epimerase